MPLTTPIGAVLTSTGTDDCRNMAGGAHPIRLPDAGTLGRGDSVVPRLAGALIPRVPQLVEELVAVARERDVRYFADVPVSDIRRSVREHALGFLRYVVELPAPQAELLAVPMAWGRCRAQEGVAMESMLRMYRLGTQFLWEKLFDEARAESPEELQRLLDESGLVWEVLDSYSSALVEGYRAAESDAHRRDSARRDALFDALVEGRGVEPAVAAEARAAFGLPARGRFVVVAMDARASTPAPIWFPALPSHSVQAVWRLRADRVVGVLELGRTPMRQLVDQLSGGPRHRVGISSEVDGLADIATAFHCAETALQTLRAGSDGVAAFDDRLLEAFVVTSPHVAERLAHRALGGLLECVPEERSLLLDTLDSWFHCGCSAARAAEELHCHRNTVLNRLRRIEALTGAPLDDDRHRLACRMALVAVHTLPQATTSRPGVAGTA
ncbi:MULTISPECIES: PucR family transcriptional regulator [unclassified Streptomyces]|uniref:PucR family transcriptional regulator n=1 Tax=unclassified Streptomyces TaxID=2593676 RepID=UPI0037FD9DFA